MSTPGDLVQIAATLRDAGMDLRTIRDASLQPRLQPNHHFDANGIRGPSEYTWDDLMSRKQKALASVSGSAIGRILALATQVNPADIVRHLVSTGTSTRHLRRFREMARQVKDGGSLHAHLSQLIYLKEQKIVNRGTQTIVSAIPGAGGAAISFGGWLVALSHELALAEAAEAKCIEKTAEDLHWQSYRELVLMGRVRDGKYAPAAGIGKAPPAGPATQSGAQSSWSANPAFDSAPAPPPMPRDIGGVRNPAFGRATSVQRSREPRDKSGPALRLVWELTGKRTERSRDKVCRILSEPAGHHLIAYKLNQT